MSNQHAELIQAPAEQPTNPSSPTGIWTIDPAHSSVSLVSRKHRLRTSTARRPCLGVIHLDALPPLGAVWFEQTSGLSVLTMALEAASAEPHDTDLDAMLGSPGVGDALRHRWWTLRSESLEILPTGAWRVMAVLTGNSTAGLVELRLEVDSEASDCDWLALRGHAVLDRHARTASTRTPRIRLDLSVRPRRVVTGTCSDRKQQEKATCTTSMPG